ncbi:MAG: NUDIX hydrolase [Parcubacteria group bacterium]|nr:NUDIX hydrolase [Parcubacteria group bacterium]
MNKKKTVGLIAITNTGKAVLQVRGDFNMEKNNVETYRSATQLTVHGSIEDNETEKDALLREAKEELGEEFANLVQGSPLYQLNKIKNEKISVINFGIRIAEKDLDKIKGVKIRLVSKDEIDNIKELKLSDRLTGVDENEIVMFRDDIEAMKLVFEKFD